MRTALLAVFLLSCAAPSGRTYRDGVPVERAPVFVTPGYAPAGAGLPEYMPTAERETVPRGKDRRVLPPSREPGIWASDSEPRASAEPFDGTVAGVSLPIAREMNTVEGLTQVAQCGLSLIDAAQRGKVMQRLERLPLETRRCLVAQMYRQCMATREQASSGSDKEALSRHVRIAKKYEDLVCPSFRHTDETLAVFDTITEEWLKLWNRPAGTGPLKQ